MNLKLVVSIILVTGMWLLVAALGLRAESGDGTALLRQPARLIRSLISMLVVMPVVAAALASFFDLDHTIKITLVALALSPVPPFLPPKNMRAGGGSSYVIGLFVATSLISIVYVPLALALLQVVFDIPLSLSVSRVIVPVASTVLVPLLAGLLIRRFAPDIAARAAGPASRLASLMLVAGLVPLLVVSLPKAMPLVGNGSLLAMVVFSVTGLGIGHLLGDGEPGDRATLALSTAARHPGVAMAIARANFPEATLVFPAVVLYIVLNAIVSLPYARAAMKSARLSASSGR